MSLIAGLTILFGQSVPTYAQQLDAYGGTTSIQCPAGPQPHFYTAKIDNRWWLCTPAGNAFFLKGIYNVIANDSGADYQGVVQANVIDKKYAKGPTSNSTLNWALQTVNRMKSWGFNTLSEYGYAYTWPVATDSRWGTPDGTIPVHLPFITIVRPSWYSFTNLNNWAKGPVKDMVAGVKTSVYTGYRSHSADFWDPNFQQWFSNALTQDYITKLAYTGPNNGYLIGFDIDETDNLQGFGAGPDFPTVDIAKQGTVQPGYTNPHIGWIVLVTASTQSNSSSFGVSYTDTKVYSKQALSDWLSSRYGGSIAKLNTAWGSKYTTFGSAGGWGSGTGILDEDGTCPARGGSACWVPKDAVSLNGATAAMKQDLDDFLLYHMQKYYSIIKSTMQAEVPGFLILGSSPIGSWGAPPRRQLLQAASQYLDVYTLGNVPPFICEDCTDVQQRIDFVSQYGGDKPWINWEGFEANADSYYSIAASGTDALKTQEQRGQFYQQMMSQLLSAKDSAGTHHVVGFQWWDLYDMRSEQTNWGFLTPRDNPYDGVSARIAAGTDQWGYPTGGEQANYGDFLTSVKAANATVYGSSSSSGSGTQPILSITAVTSSKNPSTSGDAVTFTAVVTGLGGTPVGTVRFLDGSSVLGTASLALGKATYTTSALSVGTHAITAGYAGDDAYLASVSIVVTQTVNAASTTPTLTLASSVNPATPGQSVTLTATVSAVKSPSGSVQFYDGATLLGTGAISGTSATFTTTALAAGTHSLKAVFGSLTSAMLSLVVSDSTTKKNATLVVTSSLNPAKVGQAVTFTVKATGSGPTPTGDLWFYDGNTWLAAVTMSGGVGSYTTSSLKAGTHMIGIAYEADANYNPTASAPFTEVVNTGTSAASSTTLSASPNPSTAGQAVVLRAVVSGGSGTPTGTVQFLDGGASIGTAALANGSASLSTTSLAARTHVLTAVYSGNSTYNGSTSAAVSLVVNAAAKATPTVATTSSLNPAATGQAVTFRAVVTGSNGTPTGTIQFLDGGAAIGAGTLNGASATFTTSSLKAGNHSITASYGGNGTYKAAVSAPLTETIKAPTNVASSVALSSTPNPSTAGQAVTLRATVSGGSGTPTGTVQFLNGGASLGAAAVSGGVATLSTTSLTAGGHSLTAVYSGNSTYKGSTSPAVSQTVNPASKTTPTATITSSLNPSTLGRAVTFTVKVAGSGPVPTGQVWFYDGNTWLAAQTLSNGSASFTTSSLTVGKHSIGVAYEADANYRATAAPAYIETVNSSSKASSSVALSSSANPSTAGQPIVLTAAVTGKNGTPTGTVQFLDGGSSLGTAAVAGGVARLSTKALAPGAHSLRAVYSGSGTYGGSTSAVLSETVKNSNSVTIQVTPSASRVSVGQAVFFTVTVVPGAGSPTPTGIVQFYDGTRWIGYNVLTSGSAKFNTYFSTAGAHSIGVAYSGDSTYLPSSSTPVAITVQ